MLALVLRSLMGIRMGVLQSLLLAVRIRGNIPRVRVFGFGDGSAHQPAQQSNRFWDGETHS